MKEYGKFDDNVEEYIITDPHTPVKWTNYIGTLAIFIAHDHPSIHLEYKYLMDTVINTYESIDATYPKLVQLVMGGKSKTSPQATMSTSETNYCDRCKHRED